MCSWRGRPVNGIRAVSRGGARGHARNVARLTEREIAILEVLDNWEDTVELDAPAAVARMAAVLCSEDIRVPQLAKVAVHEPARVRARLRHLLEAAGRDDLAATIPAGSKASMDQRAVAPLVSA